MPAYQYQAYDNKGRLNKGVLEADSQRQARLQLREQNLTPVSVAIVRDNAIRKRRGGKSIKISELSLVTRQLAVMLQAGLPLEEALTSVAEQSEKNTVKSIVLSVRAKVTEGYSLAQGFEEFPRAFPKLYRATIAAGEQSGHLDQVLTQLADYLEKQQAMKQKIQQALIYPSLMTLVSISVVVFLLIYVVPKIVDVFTQSDAALPLITQVLLGISHGVQQYGLYALIGLIIFGVLFKRQMKYEKFRFRVQQWILRLPLIGKTRAVINQARFSSTFGILFAASVPVLDAMRVAADLITLLPMQQAVNQAIARVREGSSIHQALKQTGFFAPMTIHLIANGEKSGQLEQMLKKSADNQENAVSNLITNLLTLFEPLLIIFMGGIVLFIVLAVLLPIFQLDVIAGQ